ncbi:MAG: GNAT family N-acetyltransferase [Anaerolineae bacterium]
MLGTELLLGVNVELSALTKADAATIALWHQDAEYKRFQGTVPAHPISEDQVLEFMDKNSKQKDHILFGLRRTTDHELIGVAEFEDINWHHGNAWLSIGLGKPYWNQGLGTEAMKLLVRYAFQELNLHRLQLTVFEYNERAQAVYRKVGFSIEGRLREWILRDGKRYDMLQMGLLASEWRENQPKG